MLQFEKSGQFERKFRIAHPPTAELEAEFGSPSFPTQCSLPFLLWPLVQLCPSLLACWFHRNSGTLKRLLFQIVKFWFVVPATACQCCKGGHVTIVATSSHRLQRILYCDIKSAHLPYPKNIVNIVILQIWNIPQSITYLPRVTGWKSIEGKFGKNLG